MQKNIPLLLQAQSCYMALERYRQDRDRNKRYTYGDQWSDLIDDNGHLVKESTQARRGGITPLTNNLIRRLVRNVIGVYSSKKEAPQCLVRDKDKTPLAHIMTTLLRYNSDINRLSTLYARSLEEFLIGGLIVHRKWYGRMGRNADCWTDYVHPTNFFIDANMRDFRSWDCSLIGEVHDISIDALCANFARNARHAADLRQRYNAISNVDAMMQAWCDFGSPQPLSASFAMPRTAGLCRVIEVWRREWHQACDDGGWGLAQQWHYYYLTPMGDVLSSGITPYAHGEHPYVVKAYPLIDGEIHSFVGDVIDQQRYTNRLISLYDSILRASAKGVLLIPDDTIPKGVHPKEFTDAWTKFNGVVVYHPSVHGHVPTQISANSTNIGISDLLNLNLKFFEDISGVHAALEGKMTGGNVSAALYDQQTENATLSLLDLLNTFGEFVKDASYKDMSNMRQFYTDSDVQRITGNKQWGDTEGWDKYANVECDLSIVSPLSTAKQHQQQQEIARLLLDKGLIDKDEFLQLVNSGSIQNHS